MTKNRRNYIVELEENVYEYIKEWDFMKKMIIEGGHELSGTIKISGAKNSAVALIPASILSDESTTIYNIPDISDTEALKEIIEMLHCKCTMEEDTMHIDASTLQNVVIPEKLSSKLRASYYFMGALLGRCKEVEIYFPGGCNIGARPIDLHLKGFQKMGATIENKDNYYKISAEKLKGTNIYLDIASVGATINLMLAATKAEGTTIISNAAKEPEIVNIATYLNNMGAKISGAGTSEIKIIGVTHLGKGMIEVIPDRIEAGTYIIAGALLGKDLVIDSIIKEHLEALTSKLKEMGVSITETATSLILNKTDYLKPINIKTLVYPGFPTDLGQPMVTLLTQAEGTSYFEETIWENRMGHIPNLKKLGATIENTNTTATIKGCTPLTGTDVIATDLRAGAAMVIAGLIAQGETTISNVEHILRGYENIVEKLNQVGAKIRIQEIE